MDFGAITIAVTIVGVIVLLIFSIALMWRKVSQDKALVVTGLKKRVISGGGGLVIPLFEKTDIISLENMKIEVRIDGALTGQGVNIRADGVAVLKVKSDEESILAAVEQFNTGKEKETIDVIKDTAKDVLEGKLREIVSKLSVEEIYKDREKFASQVQEVAAVDLAEMGLEIKAFTIRDISDANGYLEALGKKRIAEVKRDANIAEAEANMETKIKTADATREGEAARLVAETQIAESTKEKELKVQAYRKDQETEKAKADLAYEIEASKVQQEVEAEKMKVLIVKKQKEIELAEEEMKIQIVRKQREIELAEQEALRMERALEATIIKQADADKYSIEKRAEADKYSAEKRADSDKYKEIQGAMAVAEAIKLKGQASAEAKRAEGMAEVEIIRLKGIAEAEAMAKKAEAFKQYNDAAVTQMIIEKLPEIAKAVAEPLAKTEKIVVVDSGSGQGKGAARVSGYVTDILASLPETVNALTGINLNDVLKREDKQEIREVKIEEPKDK
ncbi:MAG TPA: SPFH domain-containing protein [Clostridia bacterium]|nr:SPFH domain-containing protein [Clostridia bacterium]